MSLSTYHLSTYHLSTSIYLYHLSICHLSISIYLYLSICDLSIHYLFIKLPTYYLSILYLFIYYLYIISLYLAVFLPICHLSLSSFCHSSFHPCLYLSGNH